jgi:chorismate dehydratase
MSDERQAEQTTAQRVESRLPRIAASSYLNTAPLIWSFTHGAKQHGVVKLLTDAAPARCAAMLTQGEVEAALVPVIEYQRIPEIYVVPDVCVGAQMRVRSVVLVAREPTELSDVRSIALDTSSRTSIALVQIIFREFLKVEVEWTPHAPDLRQMLDRHDAALLIGDPAMTFHQERLRVYDLAELWREYTGLGFVFAMWMVRRAGVRHLRAIDFAKARDEGLAHADEIAAQYAKALNLPAEELRAYLLQNISYHLDAKMRAGLELFYKLAHKHKLVESLRPLKMIGA